MCGQLLAMYACWWFDLEPRRLVKPQWNYQVVSPRRTTTKSVVHVPMVLHISRYTLYDFYKLCDVQNFHC